MVVNSEGRVAADRQPLCRLNVTVIAEDGANRQTGSFGGGGRVEWGYFLEDERWRQYAREAARQALVNLEAIDAPAGEMVVVLGPGWPGVLLHEAVGHGLEGDFNRKKTSTFSGRIGQRVASELCTVVDDGTIPNRRGSINIDDEGTATRQQRTDRKRHPVRLSAGPAQRAADGRGAHRQRAARELRPYSDAAHDQHLHARRRLHPRRDHPLGARAVFMRSISAAAKSISPAADSSSRPARPT